MGISFLKGLPWEKFEEGKAYKLKMYLLFEWKSKMRGVEFAREMKG